MKKVIVVSKTHLDLGFTDYAENIRRKYINTFIPSAIKLAESVNTENSKKFIWTTGSWILKEMLRDGTPEQRDSLTKALKEGNIVPHGLPFTMHTELLDAETLRYGFTIIDELDEIRGKKTVAAKMTDVPGHTAALVPLLHKQGIKLLHIGVNGASAVPEVPPCFLWKVGDAEVVVVYSGEYGGPYKSNIAEEVLYLDHTLDNHGAPSPEALQKRFGEIQKEYPGYEVTAGTLDDFAEVLWAVREKLPVYTGEIGDSWLHGSAADPYKSASLRALTAKKREWLSDGSMTRDTEEYKDFSDALLCIAEHTCGMDVKIALADYENYLKADFNKARANDKVVSKHIFREFPQGIIGWFNRKFNNAQNSGSYSTIEKSWAEQRLYIDKAVKALSEEHKAEAEELLASLRPADVMAVPDGKAYENPVTFGGYTLEINRHGGIGKLTHGDTQILKNSNSPVLEYHIYNKADYDFWHNNYSRNLKQNSAWAYADFGRPMLKYAEGKYPAGRFAYEMVDSTVCEIDKGVEIFVNLKCDKKLCEECGAPRKMQIVYTLSEEGLKFSVIWAQKDANRLTEAMFLRLFPNATGDNFRLQKIGTEIDYRTTVSKGGRNLHAVEKCILDTADGKYEFINMYSPLVSIGRGKILEYDNRIEDIEKDGISYVLHDNAWGTNFPLWCEENARFDFLITLKKD